MAHSTTPGPLHDTDGDVPRPVDEHVLAEHQKFFTFFNVAVALIFITAIELVIVYVPISFWVRMAALTVLSVVKFAAVVWWFMHLRWDRWLLTLLFVAGLVLAGGTVVALILLFQPAEGGVPL